jgi:saccharopine dehydrogenase-like NADP-dependent oxidoreductase
MYTVLVVGGTGFFGNRIAAALAATAGVNVLLAGRDRTRLEATATALGLSKENVVAVDVNSENLSQTLSASRARVLIHTAGPFQQQHYHVARAAIAAGCHYIDLADSRSFVAGINGLDQQARDRGVSVISGASTVPALSSAVVDELATHFQRLDSIRCGLSSGGRTPGLATVRGVFSYCGKPFTGWENGTWVTHYGWLGLQRHRFPPPVGVRWISHCDVPDLELFPRRYSTARSVSFHAGFGSAIGQCVVWGVSQLVRLGLMSSIVPLAAPLNSIAHWLEPIGTDKGAMFVTVDGVGTNGQPLRATWNLIARQHHGPYIPCGAAIALAQKLACGEALPVGAMPCMGLLRLDEYLRPLSTFDIQHSTKVSR